MDCMTVDQLDLDTGLKGMFDMISLACLLGFRVATCAVVADRLWWSVVRLYARHSW